MLLFCVVPGSSGESYGAYDYIDDTIYIDLKAIAYEYDMDIGDKFNKVLSQVYTHEYIHRVLNKYIGFSESIYFDRLVKFRDKEYLLGEG